MSRLTQTADSASVPVPARELSVVSADGARVHVELHGPEDAPAVVTAHGWTCNTRFWDAQVRDPGGGPPGRRLRPAGPRAQPEAAPADTARVRWPTTSKRS